MRLKYITAACLSVMLMYAPVQTKAASVDNSVYEQYENAIGLIEKCSLKCTSYEEGYLELTAKTQVSGKMNEVGFKNIVVQFSSDGENWYDEYTYGDYTGTNTKYHNINGLRLKVRGGYFYRISCVHYANGRAYGDDAVRTQTAVNVSSEVWVEPEPVITTTTTIKPVTTTTATRKVTTTTVSKTTVRTTSKVTAVPARITTVKNNIYAAGVSTSSAAGTTDAEKKTTETAKTTTAVTTSASNSPKTGDRPPVLEFTALCSSGAAALFLYSKKAKHS
ncbi:hypothetical protein [Ruminococcus flavefaciens]|uniref:hypothetical protein n=1 Tax=Ruminococcus flavefaciens TaxID=1265 RepID=UPI00048DD027|nr:hypothetical protein [Ruminococcus flavefaciens]